MRRRTVLAMAVALGSRRDFRRAGARARSDDRDDDLAVRRAGAGRSGEADVCRAQTSVWRWCVTLAVLAAAVPARAQAAPSAATLFLPWQMQAGLQDPEKPMCVGIQVAPMWGDKGLYTGKCRIGAPIGPMQMAVRVMDRRQAVGNARELGLPERFGVRLGDELNTIARLPFMTGVARLKRHARDETRAAEDKSDDDKPSWLKRAALHCAMYGAAAAELNFLYDIYKEHKRPGDDVVKAAALGCSLGVTNKSIDAWIKSKGYNMDR